MSSPPPDAPTNGAAKRQRRPNVRLIDISEHPAAISHGGQWKLHPSVAAIADPRPHFPPPLKNTPASRKRFPSPSTSPSPPKDTSPDPVDETLPSTINRCKKPKKGGGGGSVAPAPASRQAKSAWASNPVDTDEPKSNNGEDESADDSESHSDETPTPDPATNVPATADEEVPSEGGNWNNGSGQSRSPTERVVQA